VTTPPSKGLVVELYLIYFGLAQSFVDDPCFPFHLVIGSQHTSSQELTY
jgi:hypothetical protein